VQTGLSSLPPGTQQLQWQHAASENPQGSTQTMVNGQHFSGTGYQLDGTDNRDPILGIIVVNPNLESIGETKVTSQNYDAEFGQAIAGVVSVQTKSGSNEFHGSAFAFRQNDELQARNPFSQAARNNQTGKFIPDSLRNQFGASSRQSHPNYLRERNHRRDIPLPEARSVYRGRYSNRPHFIASAQPAESDSTGECFGHRQRDAQQLRRSRRRELRQGQLQHPQTLNEPGNGGFLDLDTGEILVAGVGNVDINGKIDNSLNLAPRVSVAYKLTDKTVIRAGYGRSYDIGVFGSLFGHSATQNLPVLAAQQLTAPSNFDRVFTLASGPPAATNFFGLNAVPNRGGTPNASLPASGRFFLPDGVFTRALPKEQTLPAVDAWNVTFQHQLTNTISVEAAYVGNKGTHVFAGDGPATDANQAFLEGFLNGVPRNDRRLTNVWELPFGKGKLFGGNASRAVDLIAGGWQLNTSTSVSSGVPFNVGYNAGGNIDTGPNRPNITGDPNTGGDRNRFFDPTVFANPGPGQFGHLERNASRGPNFFQTDASLFKKVKFTETIGLEFRFEVSNLFNVVNLGQPDAFLGDPASPQPNVGRITSTASNYQPRNVQWGLKLRF
jgi:hypothetical protein